jgi:hypothetical protein
MSCFISTHRFDPHLPEDFFVKRKSLAPVIEEMMLVLAVHANGQACSYTEPVVTMPQVSSILQRTEGAGSLR